MVFIKEITIYCLRVCLHYLTFLEAEYLADTLEIAPLLHPNNVPQDIVSSVRSKKRGLYQQIHTFWLINPIGNDNGHPKLTVLTGQQTNGRCPRPNTQAHPAPAT
jgi:hypothetical protein